MLKEKRDAYNETLERSVPKRTRHARNKEYIECKRRVKQVMQESKGETGTDFGRQMNEKYAKDEILYRKGVKDEKERGTDVTSNRKCGERCG